MNKSLQKKIGPKIKDQIKDNDARTQVGKKKRDKSQLVFVLDTRARPVEKKALCLKPNKHSGLD